MILSLFHSLQFSLGLPEHAFVACRHLHFTDEDSEAGRESDLPMVTDSLGVAVSTPGLLTDFQPSVLFFPAIVGSNGNREGIIRSTF